MLDSKKLEDSIKEHLGDISDEQKAAIQSALDNSGSEKELFEKLGVDEGKFKSFMQSFRKEFNREERVFAQEVSSEELAVVTGGSKTGCWTGAVRSCLVQQVRYMHYDYYDGNAQFPNCAKTVEQDSWCFESDACYSNAVLYLEMNKCQISWE